MSTPRVYQIRLRQKLTRRMIGPAGRFTALIGLFFILLATTLYSGSSASSNRAALPGHPETPAKTSKSVKEKGWDSSARKQGSRLPTKGGTPALTSLPAGFLLPTLQNSPLSETVTTYAADCETPKSAFNFGDTVCAKIEGGPPLLVAPRRFSWVTPDNVVQSRTTVDTLPQTDSFQIPARDPNNDFREVWRVNSISLRSSVRASAFFTVSDPNDQAANLSVYDNLNTSDLSGDSDVEFVLWIVNRGPDPAVAVQLTSVATNATFVSATQDTGPAFDCTSTAGGTTCTISTLEPGTESRIALLYHVVSGASAGTPISNTADISSDTTDPHTGDNSSTATAIITGEGDVDSCSLTCPGNITTPANTTQNNVSGAVVIFDSEASGDCGTVTASHASGSFFPVGDTTVTVSSSSGDSCSFTITVTDTAAPTIACPDNVEKDAGDDCSVEVTAAELGSPTATGNQVTVDGTRSDGQALDAPYPTGVTTIIWTATDADGRSISCNQTVTVTGADTTPPTITAPPDVTDTTGATGASCGKIIGETELGTASAEDNCSTVHVTRTGVPAGNFFPIGTTTITYVATDGAGNAAAPVTQIVTISDNAPPMIEAPADASYVCPSEVPAANPAQATRGDVFDENGNLLPPAPPSDNCGIPTVTVSESSSGSGTSASPLIITRIFTATDSAGNSSSDAQTITVIDSIPPTITAPADVTANTGPGANSCATVIDNAVLGTASVADSCAGVTVSRSPSGNTFAVGTTDVIWTATDAAGNTATVTQHVTVSDNTAPAITLTGANPQYVECHTSYTELGATANDNCVGSFAATPSGVVDVNTPGSYIINYNATDAAGNASAPVTRTVNVVDSTAPTITFNSLTLFFNNWTIVFNADSVTVNGQTYPYNGVSFTYGDHTFSFNGQTIIINGNTYTLEGKTLVLWTPLHQYQNVKVEDLILSANDSCDSGLSRNNVVISQVTSDEAANTPGNDDGNTPTDIVISPNCKSVQLRAERANSGNGRFYTIKSKVTDPSGNTTTVTSTIRVRRYPFQAAADSGVQYTVTSGCP